MEKDSEKNVQILPEKLKFYKKYNDSIMQFQSKLVLANLKNEYFVFIVKTSRKFNYLVSPRFSYLCPKEKKEIAIERISLKKSPLENNKEKFKFIFYKFNKNIENEEEANNMFNLKLYNQTPIQEIKIIISKEQFPESEDELDNNINDNNNFSKDEIEENVIILKEDKTIINDSIFLYKVNNANYQGIISISNETKEYVIYKAFTNSRDLYKVKDGTCFIAPNDTIKIYIYRANGPFEKEKFLLLFYSINKIIKNKEEAKEAFKFNLYNESSKREKCSNVILKVKNKINSTQKEENAELNSDILKSDVGEINCKNEIKNILSSTNENEIKKEEDKGQEQENRIQINKIKNIEERGDKEYLDNNLIKRINELEKELKEEKEKNNELNNAIKLYKEKEETSEQYIEKINGLENELKKEKEKNNELMDIIKKYKEKEKIGGLYGKNPNETLGKKSIEKGTEITELKLNLSRFNFEINGEK